MDENNQSINIRKDPKYLWLFNLNILQAPLYFEKPDSILFETSEYVVLPKKESLGLEELESLNVWDINRYKKDDLEGMCTEWIQKNSY